MEDLMQGLEESQLPVVALPEPDVNMSDSEQHDPIPGEDQHRPPIADAAEWIDKAAIKVVESWPKAALGHVMDNCGMAPLIAPQRDYRDSKLNLHWTQHVLAHNPSKVPSVVELSALVLQVDKIAGYRLLCSEGGQATAEGRGKESQGRGKESQGG